MGQPMPGVEPPRCYFHLGRKADVVKAEVNLRNAAVALLEQQRVTAEKHGLPADLPDPLQALLDLAREAAAWKEALRSLVGELTSIRYRLATGEQLRAEVVVYERAMDRLGRLLVDIARLGVEDRLARVAEHQLRAVEQAMLDTLDELAPILGFDRDDDRIRPVLAKHLRKVER